MAHPGDSGHDGANIGSLQWLDIAVLFVYFLALAAIVVWVNQKIGSADAEHFFLGGRHVHWWAIGFSLFATNVGTDHLVGLAGSGAAGGLAVGTYEFSACTILLVLGWSFVPYYLAFDVFTVPEFLEKRFGKSLRQFFTCLTIFATVFTKISVTIFAGAVVLETILGWPIWVSSVSLLGLTAAFTMVGGLGAVLYTEVLMAIFLIIGSIALLYFGLEAAGGIEGLTKALPESHFRLLKGSDHPDFPWIGVIFGMPINSLWYWCTDQVMVQNVLAADQPAEAQKACVFAGFLKLLPMYIMVVPGLVAAALFPKEIEEDSNRAYALLVTRLLPQGWIGIMVAVMLSSFMAALASCFNSCSTLFTLDIYREWYPDADSQQLVSVGRKFTALIAIVSLAWLPVIDGAHDQLFLYIQSCQVVWCPPIACIFLGARFMPTMRAPTAWHVMIFGLVIGVLFWVAQNVLPRSVLEEHNMGWLGTFNILHYSVVAFIGCWAVLGASHAVYGGTDGEDDESLGLANAELIKEIPERLKAQNWAGTTTQALAVALCVIVAALMALHETYP